MQCWLGHWLSQIAEGNANAELALGDPLHHESYNEEQERTDGSNRLEQNLSSSDSRQSKLTHPSIDEQRYQKMDEMNTSKEIPPIKVQPTDDDNKNGNYLSMDDTNERKYDGHLVTDPMEFKPIDYRYPRSEEVWQTDIIESFNSLEARDYVANRCPFLFEDLETPPLTPSPPD